MLTIVETPTFQRLWPDYWTEDEAVSLPPGLRSRLMLVMWFRALVVFAKSDGRAKARVSVAE